MLNPDGSFDDRTQRILKEQTIPSRYGRSPVMDALQATNLYEHPVIRSGKYIDISVVATYLPKLTWRERMHAIWADRIVGAWRVLIGKASAEEY